MQGLFGIQVILNVSVINHVILANIQIMEIVNAEKKPNRSISQRWQLNYGWK